MERVANWLVGGGGHDDEEKKVKVVVTDLESGTVVSEGEYKKLPGFEAKVIWLYTQ